MYLGKSVKKKGDVVFLEKNSSENSSEASGKVCQPATTYKSSWLVSRFES